MQLMALVKDGRLTIEQAVSASNVAKSAAMVSLRWRHQRTGIA